MRFVFFFIFLFFFFSKVRAQYISGGLLGAKKLPYEYAYPSVLFTGINTAFILSNIKHSQGFDKRKSNAGFGIISGALQVVYASITPGVEKEYTTGLSIWDAGVGLTAIVTSTIRLARKNPPKESPATLGLVTFTDPYSQSSAVGLALTMQLSR